MKRKYYSFILLEIVIGLFLFSLAAIFIVEGIFRTTKKTYQEIQNLSDLEHANSLSFAFLQETITKSCWDDLVPFPDAPELDLNYKIPQQVHRLAKVKWGYLPRYDAELPPHSQFRIIRLTISFDPDQKPFSYCYLVRKK